MYQPLEPFDRPQTPEEALRDQMRKVHAGVIARALKVQPDYSDGFERADARRDGYELDEDRQRKREQFHLNLAAAVFFTFLAFLVFQFR